MATELSASVSVAISGTLRSTGDLDATRASLAKSFENVLLNGTGLNQANNIWSDRRSVAGGANENLDFSGSLNNSLGVSLLFTKIKAVLIVASSANTAALTFTRPATNGVPVFTAVSSGVALAPGGMFCYTDPSLAGVTVTPATGDLINAANASGAAQEYDIVVIGVT